MPGKRTVEDRFYPKVSKSSTCWIWEAARDRRGYGQFWLEGRMHLAHRVAWQLAFTSIPADMELDHLCRNPSCVNPAHLEPVTHQENVRRARAIKTYCPQGHPYSGDNLKIGTRGQRLCRACHRKTCNQARDARRKDMAWN
jgi:hypothetical protein